MTSYAHKGGLSHLPHKAAIFVVLVCALFVSLSGWQEWASRQGYFKNAEVDTANLARSLTRQAEDSLELLDSNVLGLVARLESDGTGPNSLSALEGVLRSIRSGVPRIHGIFIYDENGRWLATSEDVVLAGRNNSDRDYFQYHLRSPNRGPWVGAPVESRSDNEWIITVSRRFNHPDGRFAGVVLASLKVGYLSEFYGQFNIGPNGSVALLNAKGIIFARYPNTNAFINRDLSGSSLFSNPQLRDTSAGIYYFKSPLDGVQRLSFYERSHRFPVVVVTTLAEDDVLKPWRREAFVRFGIVIALTGLIALVGFFLVRQLHRSEHLVTALVAKEAVFRLLAEESSDMVTRIGLDERLLYVSPSSAGVVGWSPDKLIGTPSLAGVNIEDQPTVNQIVAALKRGDITESRLQYRTRHREGKEIWIESSLRVTRDTDSGRIDGVVAISRDVTQQKEAEARMAALATRDGLTGLANRRRFDERLQEEWARAARDGTALSLLMIDVDHFKKYNDSYGHPAGDACLQAVAKAIGREARRPSDMAARYGGEEFVLLLPNTDATGCALVGERVRQELCQLRIPHTLNIPSLHVTVSVGGATMRPEARGPIETAPLVLAADQALYSAKEKGRDRLVMASEAPGDRQVA